MTNATQLATEYAQTIRQEIELLNLAIAGNTDAAEALEYPADVLAEWDGNIFTAWINECILEVKIVEDEDDPRCGDLELVRTVGGPDARIYYNAMDGNSVTVEVHWSNGCGAYRVNAPNLTENLYPILANRLF